MMKTFPLSLLALSISLVACSGQSPEQSPATTSTTTTAAAPAALPGASAPVDCAALASGSFANTTITSAELVAAGAFTAPGPAMPGMGADYSQLPAFCRVVGSIAPTAQSDIGFELWLPAQGWNGKFMQTGNGGAAGSIVHSSLADPLLRGYAVANTDTGHQGGGGDFNWASGQPEKIEDYAHRAVHELTVAGKAITSARFGRAPDKAYFNGCSTGGRQALKEAQRYPDDYDAIIAGAPANNWSALMSLSIIIQKQLTGAGITPDKLVLLKEAAIASCDALDGVNDRVIANTEACAFDPAVLQCQAGQSEQCLSSEAVSAVRQIYAGVTDSSGTVIMPGTGPGSELLWSAYASPGFSIGTSYYRNVILNDETWNPASFNVDTDLVLAEQADAGMAVAMDPDLSAYFAHGGKLITYHGTTDGLIPYGNTVNYFNSVVALLGEEVVNENARLYLVPGMEHCAGGEGAHAIDWLTPLEQWVDQGQAPAALASLHPVLPAGPMTPPGTVPGTPFTRPVCAYPAVPQYRGEGDTALAENFACVAP